jgi:N-acetyl-1-D-myo-inositol-2-amino-2-deoxy-alpha-D-glucopyranoside deacetylase
MVWVGAARAGAGGDVPERALVGVPLDEAAGRLAGLLRQRQPSVVVTYDPEGGYGHPDHVRVHEVTMRAVELWGGDPTVLWRRAGRAALAAAYRSLSSAEHGSSTRTRQSGLPGSGGGAGFDGEGSGHDELTAPDPEGPFPAVAVDDDEIDLAVEVQPVRDHVLAALRAHGTQVQAVEPVDGDPSLVGRYALSDGVLAPLLPAEGYSHVAGPAPALPRGVRRLP